MLAISRSLSAPRLALAVLVLALAPPARAEGAPRLDADAHALLSEVAQSAHSVRIALSEARRSGDPARTRCVSSKLNEVHAQMRIADQHATSLLGARSKDGVRLHRHMLEVTRQRASELAKEARSSCGESRVVVRMFPGRDGHVAAR